MTSRATYEGTLRINPYGLGIELGHDERPLEEWVRDVAEDDHLLGGEYEVEITLRLTKTSNRPTVSDPASRSHSATDAAAGHPQSRAESRQEWDARMEAQRAELARAMGVKWP